MEGAESVDSDEDVYEVEKIVDNVVVGGKTYYRVRWKNYSEDGDTWEPRENLLSCEDLLNNYIRTQSEKSSGLHLPADVFTPGTGESSSEYAHEDADKQTRTDGRKNRRTAQEKKNKKGRIKKAQTKQGRISSSESSSGEEPQVKDPFWENLKQGKIDVFASDLYSKVKQRRFPESDTPSDAPIPTQPVKMTKKKTKKNQSKETASHEDSWSDPSPNKSDEEAEKVAEEPDEKQKRITRQTEEVTRQKSMDISSDTNDDVLLKSVKETEKNAVLEYLQQEIQNKKDKKIRKNTNKHEKVEDKPNQIEETGSRKSFISSLFEESEANLPSENNAPTSSKTGQIDNISKTITKPNIVLEKIDVQPKEQEKSDACAKKEKVPKEDAKKKGEKGKREEGKGKQKAPSEKIKKDLEIQRTSKEGEESQRSLDSPKRIQKEPRKEGKKETDTTKKLRKMRDSADKESVREAIQKEQRVEDSKVDRILKKETTFAEKELKTTDVSSTDDELRKADGRGKHAKDQSKDKFFELTDAFSAQLQESDIAVSDLMLKKKEKNKKFKSGPKHTSEKSSSSPNMVMTPSTSGASVFELLTQEMEKTVNQGPASTDPKLTPFDAAMKDVHNKLGLKAPTTPMSSAEKPQPLSCAPDMVEFLKIKVNFELDEISVKDIERHHEMGEPPCRLEREVSNAEFRQYIRGNQFEMVHEALKSKKMMYNLEHTDSLWMTQLMVAAAAGFDEIVKVLSHHGARVNSRSKIGQTALMFAAEKGHDIVCRILIAYGAYINLQTTSGETALMKAAKNGHGMIVRYLLQAGADPTLKSAHGTTAREMADRAAQPSLSDVIRIHETNINAYVNECIHRECHILGIKTIGLPILATRVFNIRETALVHVTFNCVIQNLPPNQGVMLFALHGMIGSGLSIKCRMRGPCYINAVTLNNFVMDPVMPGKQASDSDNYFITNLVWRAGQNSLRLFLSQDPLSNEKLFISIFTCGFVD